MVTVFPYPSVVERPNRKQLEQSESWIFFGGFVLLFFIRSPAERRRGTYNRLPDVFILRSFAPLTVESLARPPLPIGKDRHRNLGLARENGVRFDAEESKKLEISHTRPGKGKKEQSGGNGGWEGLCRVRVVPH